MVALKPPIRLSKQNLSLSQLLHVIVGPTLKSFTFKQARFKKKAVYKCTFCFQILGFVLFCFIVVVLFVFIHFVVCLYFETGGSRHVAQPSLNLDILVPQLPTAG